MKVNFLLLASCAMVVWQSPPALAQAEAGYKAPRTSWGAPELGGFWSNTSLTSLQRPANASKLVVDDKEAAQLLSTNIYTLVTKQEAGASKLDAASSAALLADKNPNRGYNRFWLDPGSDYARVAGQIRTSWIVDPPSGQIPYKAGRQPARPLTYDGPEGRPVQERCVAYGRVGPVFGNGMYNNTFQLVQTPAHLMILAEMIHETRVIPIFASASAAKHGPQGVPKWGGDSVAWYEGDTLVVETVNTHPNEHSYISPAGKAVERFTRYNGDEILYQFRIEDPSLYSQPWSGEQSLRTSKELLYEYACHEGNYGMHGILAGARKLEADGRQHPETKPIFDGVEADAE